MKIKINNLKYSIVKRLFSTPLGDGGKLLNNEKNISTNRLFYLR